MKKGLLTLMILACTSWSVQAQNKYIVKTKGAKKVEVKAAAEGEESEDSEPTDIVSQNFRYVSLCDWKDGMRFMVVPEKKDMVIKTFTDSLTGQMVSSRSLRYKILVYRGHDNPGGLHEHIRFTCEDDGKAYYYEIPSSSFDDYCFGKLGVPTLAYLDEVDKAIELFQDQTLYTNAKVYYRDSELSTDAFEEVTDIPLGTEVTVKAIGVGTRSFPVKIIVADKDGREFYQNVTFSRTNSGLRDDEFDLFTQRPHLFKGSFELPSDNMSVDAKFKDMIGKEYYTTKSMLMNNDGGNPVKVARLSSFVVQDVRSQRNSEYVKLTLKGKGSNRIYTKDVLFASANVVGDIDGQQEDVFSSLFVEGNPLDIQGVRAKNLQEIQKGIVRKGFTEAEVQLALGRADGEGKSTRGVYSWTYKSAMNHNRCTVYFDASTKTVLRIVQ